MLAIVNDESVPSFVVHHHNLIGHLACFGSESLYRLVRQYHACVPGGLGGYAARVDDERVPPGREDLWTPPRYEAGRPCGGETSAQSVQECADLVGIVYPLRDVLYLLYDVFAEGAALPFEYVFDSRESLVVYLRDQQSVGPAVFGIDPFRIGFRRIVIDALRGSNCLSDRILPG